MDHDGGFPHGTWNYYGHTHFTHTWIKKLSNPDEITLYSLFLISNQDPSTWYKKAILNVAAAGKFSSDRTIKQYADEIWDVKPVRDVWSPTSKSKPS